MKALESRQREVLGGEMFFFLNVLQKYSYLKVLFGWLVCGFVGMVDFSVFVRLV